MMRMGLGFMETGFVFGSLFLLTYCCGIDFLRYQQNDDG